MNGNVTKEGIRKDLEWMHRIGIGGFQNFDAGLASPQIVEKRLVFMTPEWKEAFRFTTELADSLGLEMAIAGSPGWSESGGPWVPPEDGMKKYVWSETRVKGGEPFSGALPRPPSTTGVFHDVGSEDGFGRVEHQEPLPEQYADAAVFAFRLPAAEGAGMAALRPKLSSSGGHFDLAALTDGDLAESTLLPPAPPSERAWLQLEFAEPQTFRALTIVAADAGDRGFRRSDATGQALEASDDGRSFRAVTALHRSRAPQRTVTFPPATARFFRVTFEEPSPQPNIFRRGPQEPAGAQIAELVLHSGTRVHRFEDKAAFAVAMDLVSKPTPPVPASDAVEKASVVDLTAKMRPDGTLDWMPPPGEWLVVRLGWSLTGRENHPASPEATGLEVDKLDPAAVRRYFEEYLDKYEDATGGLMGEHGLQYVITDSWEAGVANWTPALRAEFEKRRGYVMLPWLPVLTGRVVESAEASDRFLWDLRATLAELVAEHHYDGLTTLLRERGMGRYTESHEAPQRAFIGDGMEVKRTADVPMSATWTAGSFGRDESEGVATSYKADVRESASVAHIYGQNLVAAESLTAIGHTFAYAPERLKPTADTELAHGLNRFVIHTSVHQPVDDKKPGLGLGPFGQWFTRHETWAEQATPWISYLARSSFLLQQGRFAADVLYVYGEDHNVTALFGQELPPIPEGYGWDFLNAGALADGVLSVTDGRLTTESGMSYRLLALDPSTGHMTLPALRAIRALVDGGAEVVGPRPVTTPSLSDDEAEFQALADELFGDSTGERAVGAGRVHVGRSVAEALSASGVMPDFAYTKPRRDTELLFVHRTLDDGDLYWVSNQRARVEDVAATFRVSGRAAEIWHPVTGEARPASYGSADGRTTVPLKLHPNDALFVVFREEADAASRELTESVESPLATVEGPWEVSFQAGRGAPPKATLEALSPWNENADPGVRYFSGTGAYATNLHAPQDWFGDGAELWLDLGEVENLAEVIVNGQPLGIVWTTPFRVKASEAMKPGDNSLEIRVTNLWVNRLIGDQQPDATEKYTYTTQAFYQADSPLLPSGLLGPVQIVRRSPSQP